MFSVGQSLAGTTDIEVGRVAMLQGSAEIAVRSTLACLSLAKNRSDRFTCRCTPGRKLGIEQQSGAPFCVWVDRFRQCARTGTRNWKDTHPAHSFFELFRWPLYTHGPIQPL